MNKLITQEHPLLVLPKLAAAIGLKEAIVLQQLHYWLEINRKKHHNYYSGRYWSYGTYEDWGNQFPFWSTRTIRRIFSNLEMSQLIISANYNKRDYDKTKWYSVDYTKVQAIVNSVPCGQVGHMDEDILDKPIPLELQETKNNSFKMNNEGIHLVRKDEKSASSKQPLLLEPDMKLFIEWYFNYYLVSKGTPHPYLKLEQIHRVHDCLIDFCAEYDLTPDCLQPMAESFFCEVKSNHNINHFATPGILEIRYYATLY